MNDGENRSNKRCMSTKRQKLSKVVGFRLHFNQHTCRQDDRIIPFVLYSTGNPCLLHSLNPPAMFTTLV
jgi:hypothetical protein